MRSSNSGIVLPACLFIAAGLIIIGFFMGRPSDTAQIASWSASYIKTFGMPTTVLTVLGTFTAFFRRR